MDEIETAEISAAPITLPRRIELEIVTNECPVADVLAFAQETVISRDDFSPDHWQLVSELADAKTMSDANRTGVPDEDAVESMGEVIFAQGFRIQGKSYGVSAVHISTLRTPEEGALHAGRTDGWRILLARYDYAREDSEGFSDALEMQVSVLRAALESLPVMRARIVRNGDREMGIRPPFGAPDVVVLALRDGDITENYAGTDMFGAAWHSTEQVGALTLVSRNREWLGDEAHNLGAYPSAVSLARAAKPGKTDYFLPLLSEEEEEALEFLLQLGQVGYNDKDNSLEFTAVLPDDGHLNWADIYTILGFQEDGTDDGEPVDIVRVTFVDRMAAEAEASLLQDMGVVVQYYEDGDVVDLPQMAD